MSEAADGHHGQRRAAGVAARACSKRRGRGCRRARRPAPAGWPEREQRRSPAGRRSSRRMPRTISRPTTRPKNAEAGHARAARERRDGQGQQADDERDDQRRAATTAGPEPGQLPLQELVGGQGQRDAGTGSSPGTSVTDRFSASSTPSLPSDVVAAGQRPREVDEDGARAQVVGDQAGAAEDREEQRERADLLGQELAEEPRRRRAGRAPPPGSRVTT